MTRGNETAPPASKGPGIAFGVFCSILMVIFALITYAMASGAIAKEDRTQLALSLFPGVVTLIFAGFFAFMLADRRRQKIVAERRALNPDQPWLWTDQWRDGRVRSASSWGMAAFVLVCAAVWNAAFWSADAVLYRRGELWDKPGATLVLLLFDLVGLGLIVGAVYLVLRARKYPRTTFELSPVPGVLGGSLSGWIEMPPRIPAGAEARVKVACTRTVRSSGRSGSSSVIVWQDELTLPAPAGGSLPVAFTIPFDLPPSELPELAGSSGSSPISWTLSVTVSTPGVDYHATYGVPVFATDASDPSIVRGAVDLSSSADRPSHAKATLVEASAARTMFALPPAKGLGCGISALVLLPLLAWPIARLAGSDPATSLMATAVALLVGAGVLALSGLGVALTATSIEIDGEAIRVPHGRWPVRWVRTIPLAEVTEVRLSSTETQRVDVLTRGGASYWISGQMSGPEEAKWLAAEVTRAIARHRVPAAT